MQEKWKNIKGYENKYAVSSTGRVKSLPRTTYITYKNGVVQSRDLQGGIMNLAIGKIRGKKAYYVVALWKDGKKKHFRIHRLVALHFVENPNNYSMVNHKDENKLNNKVENLEWCSPKQNCRHSSLGERNPDARLTGEKVRKIRALKSARPRLSNYKIAERFNVSKTTISNILTRRHWRHI